MIFLCVVLSLEFLAELADLFFRLALLLNLSMKLLVLFINRESAFCRVDLPVQSCNNCINDIIFISSRRIQVISFSPYHKNPYAF